MHTIKTLLHACHKNIIINQAALLGQ